MDKPTTMTEGALFKLADDLAVKLNDLEFRCCYSAAIARLTRSRYRMAKWIVAAAASVPFITYLRAYSGDAVDLISALAPLLAVALPLWNAEQTIAAASKLHGNYLALLPPLRNLWRTMRDFDGGRDAQALLEASIRDLLQQTESQSAALGSDLLLLPDSSRLKRICSKSVPRYSVDSITPPEEEHEVLYGAPTE